MIKFWINHGDSIKAVLLILSYVATVIYICIALWILHDKIAQDIKQRIEYENRNNGCQIFLPKERKEVL
jgi:hypothetical protein